MKILSLVAERLDGLLHRLGVDPGQRLLHLLEDVLERVLHAYRFFLAGAAGLALDLGRRGLHRRLGRGFEGGFSAGLGTGFFSTLGGCFSGRGLSLLLHLLASFFGLSPQPPRSRSSSSSSSSPFSTFWTLVSLATRLVSTRS